MATNIEQLVVPPFLQGVVLLMEDRKYAGEWELKMPGLTTSRGFLFPLWWVVSAIEQFHVAFPWATLNTMQVAVKERDSIVWSQQDGPFDAVLAQLRQAPGYCGGCEATVDLLVDWIAPDGLVGQSVLPKAAELLYSIDVEHTLSCTLTIRPNVFTDEIYIYEGETRRAMTRRLIHFQPAARANRARLRTSLREWERLCSGQIVWWESYKSVETGIERYGFAEDAQPF